VTTRQNQDNEELALLRARCSSLEDDNAQLRCINEALMNRVERDMDLQGNSFSLFQAAIALEGKVKERTAALTQAMHTLEQTNRELQASNETAHAASRAKSAFLAAMSHELRTPMNGVVGMTELLLCSPLDGKQREAADTIRHSALSLLKILNDILDFSKIEAGCLVTEATSFDLRTATNRALQLLKPQIDSKGLTTLLDWPEELPSAVVGDPTRYTQIITNLVGNAVKFTAQGHIRLRARVLSEQASALVFGFEIEDTGVGIQSDVIPRLFESFTQADSSTTRQYGGSGLGLAIVRRLCRLMGGDCGVSSEYGKGSCFWFSLTLQRDLQYEARTSTAPSVTSTELQPVAGARELHILVVEDNPVNQLVARRCLEKLGCRHTVVDNGLRAVEALTEPHCYDLVLMDCQMPELDGLEATRRVRAYEAGSGAHVPIIALTANAMTGDSELCLQAGMDGFLSKPFQLSELTNILDTWRPKRATPRISAQMKLAA